MEKYNLLPEQLLYEGTLTNESFFTPSMLDEPLILRVHTAEYWEKLKKLALTPKEIRATGFPISARLIERERLIAQGTIQCAEYALQYGIAMNIAGGTHHAFTNRGEGFCLLNDIALAARYLLDHQKAQRILIIDLDVHQGNGTAEIFRQEPAVFTFSMHGANNYPRIKEQSDCDVHLPDGTGDRLYLYELEKHLDFLFSHFEPDFVFFQAGVDVLATDKLGRLALSIDGCRQRDELVFQYCRQGQIPVVVSMGGGYSPRLADILEAHANTYRTAQFLFF
ncbi:acetoin utilization deacetylase AcuC-like enzyme [Thermonema lapsum]|uniref:Acetoin utilization deacetylase AcuC-like enzyme n=2 Tax=Thermonema lapsum TaxID=28195 RepID=A0A846MN07_9BACT|nr:acetoin utilization deacetylase AcuC-like enzyme [Thermonema lapsum]